MCPILLGIFLNNKNTMEEKEQIQQEEQKNEAQQQQEQQNETNLNKFLNVYFKLQAILPKEDRGNLYIGGSLALAFYGLKDFSEVHDLDLRIDLPCQETKQVLARLENVESPYDSSFAKNRNAGAQVIMDGVDVDIFYMKERFKPLPILYSPEHSKQVVLIASIPDIIAGKLALGRKKDLISLLNLSQKFWNPEYEQFFKDEKEK